MRNNEIIFISFQLVSTVSVLLACRHIHSKREWCHADRLADRTGSVVKVEAKRMKDCIFLLVLRQLKTSAVFSYTWSKCMHHIHALTV